MAFRRSYRTRTRRYRGGSRRRNNIGKLVNGRAPMTYPERLLRAGAPYAKVVPALARTAGMFARMINSEVHYKDTNATTQPVTNAGLLIYLTGLVVGDRDTERNGNKVLGKDLLFRFTLRDVTQNTFVRMIIFCDKQSDGVLPTLTQLLQSNIYTSPLNQDYSKRFAVLKDKTYSLSTENPVMNVKGYIPIPFHLLYDGLTAAIADSKENQVFALFVSNVPTNAPNLDYYFRFKFHDN